VADYTVKVVELFSKDFGQYAYPKMVVADARDGMEYPMLTLCGGLYPGNKALIAHEVGHNWYYGIIGSNETYRAMLDEGFTQFLTVWALDNIPDEKNNALKEFVKRKKWKERFGFNLPARDTRAYLGYMLDAVRHDDMPLNTHSDMFQGALRQGGGYRHVYSKTATMLYNLQYVLGDTLFQNAMKHYYNQWKMAHPYPDDFRHSIIDYTKTDLNWFFDQWMETTKTIDYKVGKVTKGKGQGTNAKGTNDERRVTGDEKTTQITFKRKGEMQMPLDFTVITKNGDSLNYHIPNTWFEKKTEAKILPRWIGWQKLKPTYTSTISVNDKIKDIIIDPTYRLADINMMNNAKKAKAQLHWDAQVYHAPDWRRYHIYTRPELWWNAVDGFKLGWHFNGNYMQYRHQFAFSFWIPTGLAQGDAIRFRIMEYDDNLNTVRAKNVMDIFNYRFSYETGLNKIIKGLSVFFTSGYVEGLEFYRTGFSQKIRNSSISIYMKLMTRPRHNKDLYVLNGLWLTERINNTLNLEWNHRYQYDKGIGKINITLRSASIASDYDYTYVEATKINYTKLWRFELRSRFYARCGFGDKIPLESALDITGANNEMLMDYPLLRSKGYVAPQLLYDKWYSTVYFQQGGGLNLRGFADMYIAMINPYYNVTTYHSLALSGGSINLELDLDGLIKWQPKTIRDYLHLDVYLFFDAAITPTDKKVRTGNGLYTFAANGMFPGTNGKAFADGGIGFALTLKKFGALEKIKPFTIRCDLPWWATYDLFSASKTEMGYRFMFGLYRSF
jgi:aminopeptidase N